MVTVQAVDAGSPAELAGILAGDILLSINDHPIADVLDYQFYLSEKDITMLLHRGSELLKVQIQKEEYADIGLEFETFLMDEKHSCRNKCIFCFIDQLPKGMRESLYFKDDDSRLSFLLGNYVTLTNLSEEEIDRIVYMKTSPLHISVHTTDPALRVKMMKNKNAGKIFGYLQRFAEAGIDLECQIVLCRGYNDGEALIRTMRDLATLAPHMQSVAIVPSGLTDHRDKLCHLEPFDKASARETVKQVEAFAAQCYAQYGTHIFFCSDEFYLLADLLLPPESYYEGYPQLENGVGMITSMQEEFDMALPNYQAADTERLHAPRQISLATGVSAYPFISKLVRHMEEVFPWFSCRVYCIENRFFGKQITVAGLITAKDLMEQLAGKDLGECLCLPQVMLRSEGDLFLDNVSREEVSERLCVPLRFVPSDGDAFLAALLGET